MAERLNLEALRYARSVAHARSFSAAARAHGITQPALSNAVARLEERLGVRLFERSTRGVTLTAEAVRLIPLVDTALSALDAITAEARRMAGPEAPRIRLGVSPLISPDLVARAFGAVRRLPVPGDLVLREANMADLHEALAAGELDVILIPSVNPLPRFEHRVIHSERVVVIDAHAEASSAVELSDTADAQFILVPDACGLTRFTTQLFREHDLPLRTYPGEAGGYQVLEQWVGLGLGAAILPESKLSDARLTARPLIDDGRPVELFYEAVWDPTSRHAADLSRLVASLGDNRRL
ncbi:LysR family transcriptional regulator [Nonomuraea rhodomycinica]|uniref:LysR family transcriptional regulator n=1 Tax=Nonomuraea rhodomycinica TaxID=1712872 RepID=A0A7Y6MA57_9ACTN|nr:LysR family transcriptional regulator [Nonomuraea rhodomycinica]NUW39485.1 LysR family transcriptional regulator [Nonomuraea rhodomycinica]